MWYFNGNVYIVDKLTAKEGNCFIQNGYSDSYGKILIVTETSSICVSYDCVI